MKHIPVHRIASALLTMLVLVSIVVFLRKTDMNRFYYGIPFAGLLSYAVVVSTWKTQTNWLRTIAAACLIPMGFAATLYFSIRYGWPFGSFTFSDMFGLEISDNIPWTFPVFWTLLIATAANLVRHTYAKTTKAFVRLFTWTFDTSFLATLTMIAMLPAMSSSGLLTFRYDIGYEGVSIQFYLAAFMISMLMSALMFAINGEARLHPSAVRSQVIAVCSLLAFWIVSSFTYELPVAMLSGLILLFWMIWKQHNIESTSYARFH